MKSIEESTSESSSDCEQVIDQDTMLMSAGEYWRTLEYMYKRIKDLDRLRRFKFKGKRLVVRRDILTWYTQMLDHLCENEPDSYGTYGFFSDRSHRTEAIERVKTEIEYLEKCLQTEELMPNCRPDSDETFANFQRRYSEMKFVLKLSIRERHELCRILCLPTTGSPNSVAKLIAFTVSEL